MAARPPAINNAPMHGVASGPISAAAAGETQTPPPPFFKYCEAPALGRDLIRGRRFVACRSISFSPCLLLTGESTSGTRRAERAGRAEETCFQGWRQCAEQEGGGGVLLFPSSPRPIRCYSTLIGKGWLDWEANMVHADSRSLETFRPFGVDEVLIPRWHWPTTWTKDTTVT